MNEAKLKAAISMLLQTYKLAGSAVEDMELITKYRKPWVRVTFKSGKTEEACISCAISIPGALWDLQRQIPRLGMEVKE